MLIKLLTKFLNLMTRLTSSLLVGTAVGVQFTNVLICVAMFMVGPITILDLCSRLT